MRAQEIFFRLCKKWNYVLCESYDGAHGEAVAAALYKLNLLGVYGNPLARGLGDSGDVVDFDRLANEGMAFQAKDIGGSGRKGVDAVLNDTIKNQVSIMGVRIVDPDDRRLSLTGDVLFFTQILVLPELNRYDAENPGIFDVIAGMDSIGATNKHLHAAMKLGNLALKLQRLRSHRDWRRDIMDVLVRVAKLRSVEWLRAKLVELMPIAPALLERRPVSLATSLRGDDLIRWFEDVLLCLPRNGVQATLDYIAEENRSWDAALRGAATCRPFEPLGPLASADTVEADLLREFPCLSQAHAWTIAKNAVNAARACRVWHRDGCFEAREPQGAMDRFLARGSRAPSPPPSAAAPAPAPKGMDRYMQKQKPPPVPPPRAPKKPSGMEPGGMRNLDEAPPASPGTLALIDAMEDREAGAAPAPAPSSPVAPPASPAAPPAAAPPPQSPANDAAAEGENSWTCPACTYRHVEAEAGFLACAMCGATKVDLDPDDVA
ncbi:unnamed protein product [Pelagomonas calceolata]|uniref:Uncharacterized protein n=1 Tax=Pelagomonas calceolata TaxID=35677 RepID=A0A8J2SWU4_9STRA|nr:unnamed protein product [Pelagomonas calceolata]